MSKSHPGKTNPNYKHGRYVNPTCKCGEKKDPRSKQCFRCRNICLTNNDELLKAIKSSSSYTEAASKIGCSRTTISSFVRDNKVVVEHMRPGRSRETHPDKLFVKGVKRINATLKKRILRDKLIEYICSSCKQIPKWNGKELVLQLEHKNGNPTDNRIGNLTFLCPNCHTQTDTYTGKAIKKRKRRKCI